MAMEFLPEESQSDSDARAEPEPGCPEEAPETEQVEGPSATAEALFRDEYLSMDFETRRKAINGFWSHRERELVTAGQLEPRRGDEMSRQERRVKSLDSS